MKKYFFILLFVSASLLFSIGSGRKQEITGRIRLVGNAPFINIAIYSEQDKIEYIFDKRFFNEYRQYENKVITIKAIVKKEILTLADKSASITVYNIVDSSIIKK